MNYTSRATLWQNKKQKISFVMKVTINVILLVMFLSLPQVKCDSKIASQMCKK